MNVIRAVPPEGSTALMLFGEYRYRGLEQPFDGLLQSVLALCTDLLFYDFTTLDEDDRGDVAYTEATWKVLVLVYVALTDDDLAFVFLSEFVDDGSYHLARAAPRSTEVKDYGLVTGDERVEVLAVDF